MTSQLQLVRADNAVVIVSDLKLAATFWSRFRGLQFRREFPMGEGLLIAPCRSVHTHWMRFPIDVVMLDSHGVVMKVQQNLRPWRTCGGPTGTRYVLEVPGNTTPLKTGHQLAIRPCNGESEALISPLVKPLIVKA